MFTKTFPDPATAPVDTVLKAIVDAKRESMNSGLKSASEYVDTAWDALMVRAKKGRLSVHTLLEHACETMGSHRLVRDAERLAELRGETPSLRPGEVMHIIAILRRQDSPLSIPDFLKRHRSKEADETVLAYWKVFIRTEPFLDRTRNFTAALREVFDLQKVVHDELESQKLCAAREFILIAASFANAGLAIEPHYVEMLIFLCVHSTEFPAQIRLEKAESFAAMRSGGKLTRAEAEHLLAEWAGDKEHKLNVPLFQKKLSEYLCS